jgi:VWFA-related protein
MLVGSWIGETTMAVRLQALGLSLLLILSPVSFAAHQAAPATSNPATNQQPPVIHSTTRLVQLSVIAQDGRGQPITGLKKEDFSLFDEGKPQVISFFSCGAPTPATPAPLPSNYFTNRFDLKGEDPGAVTVILFDSLNTSSQDQAYVRRQILSFLQTVKPQDHVALYALSTNLIVLHDFTRDVSALVAAASRFTPKEIAAFDASTSQAIDFESLTGDPQLQSFQNALNSAEGQIADQNVLNRIGTTASALEMIAAHVATISGRKSLVWVSGGFPIQIGSPKIGIPQIQMQPAASSGGGGDPRTEAGRGQSQPVGGGDPTNQLTRIERETSVQTASIRKAADALNRVNMAIYPVDARGVTLNAGMTPSVRSADVQPSLASSGFFDRQDTYETANLLADRTGGKAFYGTNDISDAVRRAFDDGRYACNLGFYPDHGQWDGKFRELKVKLKADGARLRYRQGYYASADASAAEDTVKSDLEQAVMSPLDTTSLGMIVNGKVIAPLSARNLQLQIGLNPLQFLLKESGNRQQGALDMAFVQRDAAGNILVGDKQHLGINFEQKQYEFLSKSGMILQRNVTVLPNSEEIRVVVRDSGSGAVGSVNIPVKAFFPASENTSRTPASN